MPIPNSGPLSLSTIQTEFGGVNPISISEYYAGGANVPAGTTGINGAVPSSGTISFSRFYGTADVQPLTASANPTSAGRVFTNNPASNSPSSRVLISSAVSVTPSGGVGPYTYSWARVSGSSAISAGSPTSSTTDFSGSVPIDSQLLATFRCTVTDSGNRTATVDVPVGLDYLSGF